MPSGHIVQRTGEHGKGRIMCVST